MSPIQGTPGVQPSPILAPGNVTFPELVPVSTSGVATGEALAAGGALAAGDGIAAGGGLAVGGATGGGVTVDDGAGGGVYTGVVVKIEVLELGGCGGDDWTIGDVCTIGVVESVGEEEIASKIGAVEDSEAVDWIGTVLFSVDVVDPVVDRGRVVGPGTSPAGTQIVVYSSTVTQTSSMTVIY